MDLKYKNLIKNIGYLTLSNFASKILVFLIVPLYTSALSPEEYGCYDAIVTTIQFVTPIIILNITDGVMRYLLDKTYNNDEIISIGNKYIFIGVILSGLLLGLNSIFHFFNFLNGYEGYAFGYSVVFILNNYYIQYAKGLNKVKIMATAGAIGTFITLSANMLFLYFLKCGIYGFFIANITGLAVPTIYLFLKMESWKSVSFFVKNKQTEKHLLLYSLPLIFNTIGWTINTSLDKYCAIYFIGLGASGILAIAYKIPTILNVIYTMFTQAWQISAVTEYESKERENFYCKTFLIINAIGSLGCAGLLVINKFLASILFVNDFYQAWKFVPFLLISTMFNQTAGFMGPLLSAKKNSSAMAKAAVAGSASNLLFNIILIKTIGIQGATIATAISSFVIYFVRWWYAKDLLNPKIYPLIYLSWVLLVMSAIAEISGIQYTIQCLVLLLILFIFRKQYLSIFKLILKKR